MMRKLAVSCLIFSAWTVTLAQAPAEWRPNISDINQAATYDDTMHFILTTLNDPSASKVDVPEEKKFYSLYQETYGANSDKRCQLVWNEIQILHPTTKRWEMTVDLTKLDPLTIKVVPVKIHDGSQYSYNLDFDGTSNEKLANTIFSARITETILIAGGYGTHKGQKFGSLDEAKTFFCSKDKPDKYCHYEELQQSSTAMWFADQEMAHRVARALMGMALLCGGKKAVSPY